MKSKINGIYLIVIFSFLSGCSTYRVEDYGEPDTGLRGDRKESKCVNMESAQEAKCKERENTLVIFLGGDKNCSHPYQYQKNKCKYEKDKQKKLLDKSLDKSLAKHVK